MDEIIDNLNKSIVSTFEKDISIVCNICESPIEKLFLLRIIDHVVKRHRTYSMSFIFEERDETEIINGAECVGPDVNYSYPSGFGRLSGIRITGELDKGCYIDIFPQYKITYSDDENCRTINYRLDFGVFKYSTSDNELLNKYCIECDGLEFHRNQEQMVNDNQRMRNLLFRRKFITMRFLGTQIYNMGNDEIGELLFRFTNEEFPEY